MAKVKRVIITPKVILVKENDDLNRVLNYLQNDEEVIVNVSLLDMKASYRIVNFLSGYVYAYNGKRKKLEDKIYSFKLR